MEKHSSILRGLVNDLLRSLSAALVHVDDLIMKVERNSDVFPDAVLTNEQLSRSIELFMDLRSECSYLIEQLFIRHNYSREESHKSSIGLEKQGLNEIFTTVLGYCDLMLLDSNKTEIKNRIPLIIATIENHLTMQEHFDENKSYTDDKYRFGSQLVNSLIYNKNRFLESNSDNNHKHILLVEDNKAIREITSLSLSQECYNVFESEDGASAKKIFYQENGDFNLCIIDLGLPDTNGAILASELNDQKITNILFISGQDDLFLNKHKSTIRKYNFLKKPYRIRELIDMVGKLCQ